MKVTADSRKRVILPDAKPGDCFEVRMAADGTVILRLLEPVKSRPAKVKVEKRDGFTVGVLDRPIDESAVTEALSEFP